MAMGADMATRGWFGNVGTRISIAARVLFSSRTRVMRVAPQSSHGGGYGSGGYGHGGMSDGSKYPHGFSGAGLFLNHSQLMQKARLAMQDSSQGRAIVDRKVDAIAHTGLRLEPTPEAGVLGVSQEEASEWARDVAARFHLWSGSRGQHRAETMTFYQAQRLFAYFKERENDVFLRLYYSPDNRLQNPLQFEFLDPAQITGHGFTNSYGFAYRHDGIDRDSRGREVAYNVRVYDGSRNAYEHVTIKARGPKSGRIFMLHGWSPEYAGQGRGFTKLAPILQELESLTDFTNAHIKQAINQAQFVMWVVPSKDEDAEPVIDGNLTAHGRRLAGGEFSAESTSGDPLVGDPQCYDFPEATTSQPGGWVIQSLSKGADIKMADPNTPSTTYDKFIDAFLKGLSACSGTPLEVVHMKFANNFSASRATLLLFQRIVEIEREDMGADLLNPIYEMWLAGEIAAGRIFAPGWSDPRLRHAWLNSTWRGSPVPDIDPGKLAKARRDNLETGVTNVEREAQQHTGMSAADNIAINNRVFKEYQRLPFSKEVAPAGKKPDDDETEDN